MHLEECYRALGIFDFVGKHFALMCLPYGVK